MKRFVVALALIMAVAGAAGCSKPAPEKPVAFPDIDGNAVLQHTKVLSSDGYEGRAPGTKGEELTVSYIQDEFRKAGVKPGNPDGTFIQKVPLVGITPDPTAALTFTKGAKQATLKFKDDFVAWTKRVATPGRMQFGDVTVTGDETVASETVGVNGSEMVFVGYGVQAPEFNWDDYKGVDLHGKTMVVLVNDPPVPDPNDPSRLDPKVFGGRAMTYYGRWTYKYDIGAEKGVAGVLIVHETAPAGYPWSVVQSFSGERFDLVTANKNMDKAAVEGWITLDQAKKLFAMAGKDFDALKQQAVSRGFHPVPLGVTASTTLQNKIREVDSRNVLGRLEGGDPKLKDEYVIYTAHWDHFGVGRPVNGDRIYHGAVDDASGVAGLIELARAFAKLPTPPKRSLLFLAVTGEEQGLLGSEYYATHPIYPLTKTLADLNMDAFNDVHGKTTDITIVGLGNSDLDDYARTVAAEQGRVLRPDAEPEKGFYYRSDHFSFAKQGVPALDPDGGIDIIGKPPGYGMKIRDEYTARDYHKPSDVVKPDWDMSGAVEDLQFMWMVGYDVAQAASYPQWKPGTEFKAKREAELKKAGAAR